MQRETASPALVANAVRGALPIFAAVYILCQFAQTLFRALRARLLLKASLLNGQKVPGIFDALKMEVDGKPTEPGKYILTGSRQFRLQSNMTDSLAGRAAFLKLLPFSVSELKAAGIMPETAYDMIYNGQYPPLYDPDKHFIPEDWYESYIDTYTFL